MRGRVQFQSGQIITPLMIALLVALIGTIAWPLAAAASEMRTGDTPGVALGETVNDDLYLFGREVVIAGTVNGDAIVSAGDLNVTGRVDGNLMILAGQVTITGTIERAVRVAAGEITVTGDIGGDLIVAGGRVTIESTGAVGGDLVAAGGEVEVFGPVDGDVRGYADQLRINDQIGGDVRVTVDDLELGSGARIAGDLDYTSENTVERALGSTIAGEERHQEQTPFDTGDQVSSVLSSPLLRLVWALVAGLFLVLLLPRATAIVADGIRKAPASAFLLGLIALIVIPFVTLILLITVVGIPIAIVLGLSYLIVLYLSQIFLGLALGRLILPKSWDTWGRGYNLLAMTLGVIALAGLRIIPLPILPTVVSFITMVFGLGAIIVGPRRWRAQPTAAVAY